MGQGARIVHRRVIAAAREGDGQLAARVDIAEEDIRDGVTTLRPGLPGFQDCGYVLRCPVDAQRASVQQDKYNRLAQGYNRFEQLFLAARQIQRAARCCFTGHIGLLTEDHDDDVCTLRRIHGILEGCVRLFGGLHWLLFTGHEVFEEGGNVPPDLRPGGVLDVRIRLIWCGHPAGRSRLPAV